LKSYENKIETVMVNNSPNSYKRNNHLSREIIKHKRNHSICWWKL